MKILVQNYSSALSTEPMYIHRCIIESTLAQSYLWADQNQSAFDTFDYVKPDIFISHFRFLTNDIIKYLSQNKNIAMALNVTGASQENIDMLENIIEKNNINIPLIFTNLYESTNNISSKKLNFKHVYPATDVFLPVMPTPDYELDTCFFSLENDKLLDKLKSKEEKYHIVSLNNPSDERYADMYLDITRCFTFYQKYKRCVLVGDINFVTSQLLYDCILRSKSINIHVPDDQQNALNNIIKNLFEEVSGDDISNIIKTQVMVKHNCIRRTSRLFRLLKVKELSDKLETMNTGWAKT